MIQSDIDDGQRLRIVAALSNNAEEVVLALSISYPVDEVGIAATFPGMPVMHMEMDELSSNAHWSLEKQSAFGRTISTGAEEIVEPGRENHSFDHRSSK